MSLELERKELCPECEWLYTTSQVIINRKNLRKNRGNDVKRGGVFLFDPVEDKVLVVETYNTHIGLPKGGSEENESPRMTAQRELEEETGVKIDLDTISKGRKHYLYNRDTYFMIDSRNIEPFKLSIRDMEENDVTGIGFVHVECLAKLKKPVASHLGKMLEYYKKVREKYKHGIPNRG